METIHRFKLQGLDGKEIHFSNFRGRKILIVNVASACGFTPQYAQLQELQKYFKEKLVVVGCPCNDFGNQEPGTAEEIQSFCTTRYGVSFPMTEKIRIKAPHTHPLYQWLTQAKQNGVANSTVSWNFQKYLLDEAGKLTGVHPPSVTPLDDPILDWAQA